MYTRIKIEACILKSAEQTAIRSTFGSKSSELDKLCIWLNENECYHVAINSLSDRRVALLFQFVPKFDLSDKKDKGIICSAPTNLHHRGFTCRIEMTAMRISTDGSDVSKDFTMGHNLENEHR